MRRVAGFTLVELLIVVAIIGIMVAVTIPNLVGALDRSRAKKTMADMRAVGHACEDYSVDYNFYPIQAMQGDLSAISPILIPDHADSLPARDGWSWSLQYGTTDGGTAYTIRSLGKDGIKNGGAGRTRDFDCDIVFQDSHFTAYPSGVPRDLP